MLGASSIYCTLCSITGCAQSRPAASVLRMRYKVNWQWQKSKCQKGRTGRETCSEAAKKGKKDGWAGFKCLFFIFSYLFSLFSFLLARVATAIFSVLTFCTFSRFFLVSLLCFLLAFLTHPPPPLATVYGAKHNERSPFFSYRASCPVQCFPVSRSLCLSYLPPSLFSLHPLPSPQFPSLSFLSSLLSPLSSTINYQFPHIPH